MTSNHGTKGSRIRDLPGALWIANGMEVFERTAWYGCPVVSGALADRYDPRSGRGRPEQPVGQLASGSSSSSEST